MLSLSDRRPLRSVRCSIGWVFETLRNTAGVESVTFSGNGLFGGGDSGDRIEVEGYTATGKDDRGSRFDNVGPHYFSALGIPDACRT